MNAWAPWSPGATKSAVASAKEMDMAGAGLVGRRGEDVIVTILIL
jgi:hypothetical protein